MPSFKARLAAGEKLAGPLVILDCPDVVEIIGRAGWDFAVLDCEHGPFGNEAAGDLMRACKAGGLHPIVRVPANEDWLINKALDSGAEAVIVPQVNSIEAARRAVAAAKYAPRGTRGANPFTRAAEFGALAGPDYYPNANDSTAVVLMVEGAGGARDFAAMAQLEDADAFFIGPVDLSHSLGVPGQPNHPVVLEKIQEMIGIGRERGKPVGVFANDLGRARSWLEAGAQFVGFSVDTLVIYEAFRGLAAELKKR